MAFFPERHLHPIVQDLNDGELTNWLYKANAISWLYLHQVKAVRLTVTFVHLSQIRHILLKKKAFSVYSSVYEYSSEHRDFLLVWYEKCSQFLCDLRHSQV